MHLPQKEEETVDAWSMPGLVHVALLNPKYLRLSNDAIKLSQELQEIRTASLKPLKRSVSVELAV